MIDRRHTGIKGHPKGSSGRGSGPASIPNRGKGSSVRKKDVGLHLWPQAASLPQAGITLSPKEQPPPTQLVNNLPRFPSEFDRAPLGDAARRLTSTPSVSVYSLEFEANFLASTRPKPIAASLFGMRQKEEEPLDPYLARFT
ncbi:hypothetical protein BHM03_00030958 [Ensete ventricosum]|nr:hypothetical protein BHM03_00030958 [Ensete ventricosum]